MKHKSKFLIPFVFLWLFVLGSLEGFSSVAPSCPSTCGPNLINNGDFDSPVVNCGNFNNFFTTGNYVCPMNGQSIQAGNITFGNNPNNFHNGWVNNGNGTNVMIIDGAAGGNTVVWSQDVTVDANKTYSFCVQVRNLWINLGGTPPSINLAVNGVNQPIVTLPNGASGDILSTDGWVLNTANFTAQATGIVRLSIVVTPDGATRGNDLAIDNLSFAETGNGPVPFNVVVNPNTVCSGNQVAMNIIDGNANMSYAWTGPNLNQTSGINVTANPVNTAASNTNVTYTVTGSVANSNCPDISKTVNVTVLPGLSISGPKDPICLGSTIRLTATGGIANSIYTWNGPSVNNVKGNFIDVTPTTAGTSTYTVSNNNPGNNACITPVSFTVIAQEPYTINISSNLATPICSGQTATLTASGASANVTYTWNGGTLSNFVGASANVSPTTRTTYTVTAAPTSGGGCTISKSFILDVNTSPIVTVSGPNSLCPGQPVTICATATRSALSAGDIAIIRYRGSVPNQFAFVPLVSLQAGTVINFTDNGWNTPNNSFTGGEGVTTYTAPTNIAAGTVISMSGLSLQTSDQILAYQGSASAPKFIYGFSSNRWITSGTASASTSYLPNDLVNGLTAIDFINALDNSRYNILTTTGTKASILTSIGNGNNWIRNSSSIGSAANSIAWTFNVTDLITPGFNWTGGSYTNSGTCNGPLSSGIQVNSAGTFNVTYTDVHGCQASATKNLTSPNRNVLWATYFGGEGNDFGLEMDLRSDNYPVFAGNFDNNSLTFPTTITRTVGTGTQGIFITKLKPDGSESEWTSMVRFGTNVYQFVSVADMVVDKELDNAVYVTGQLAVNGDDRYAFVMKFDAQGFWKWTRVIRNTMFLVGEAIDVTKDGVYMAGSSMELWGTATGLKTFTPGPNIYGHFGGIDIICSRLNKNDGEVVWNSRFGGEAEDCTFGHGMIHDKEGNVYVVGNSQEQINPIFLADEELNGHGSNQHFGMNDGIVVRFTPNGFVNRWTKIGTPNDEWFQCVDLDAEKLYVGGIHNTPSGRTSWMLRFESGNLKLENQQNYGGVATEVESIKKVPGGNVFIAGSATDPTLSLGSPLRAYTGVVEYDMFLTEMNPVTFAPTWQTYWGSNTLGTPKQDNGMDLAIDANSDIYLSGYTQNPNFEWVSNINGITIQSNLNGQADGAIVKIGCNNGSSPAPKESASVLPEESLSVGSVLAYPNPFSETINIYVTGTPEEKYDIEVYTVDGLLVERIDNLQCNKNLELGDSLQRGLYLVRITSTNLNKTIKISKD